MQRSVNKRQPDNSSKVEHKSQEDTGKEIDSNPILIQHDKSNIILIAFSLFLVVGFPIWWFTTMIYKADLPLQQIYDLVQSSPVPQFNWDIKVYFEGQLPANTVDDETLLVTAFHTNHPVTLTQLNSIEMNDNTFSGKQYINSIKLSFHQTPVANQEDNPFSYSLQIVENQGKYELIVTEGRQFFLNLEGSIEKMKLSDLEEVLKMTIFSDISLTQDKVVKSSAGYHVNFALLNENPNDNKVEWEIKEGLSRYFNNFLSEISPIADFHVDSQTLYYTNLKVNAVKDARKYFLVGQGDLPHFVNAAEWNLGFPAAKYPSIYFCLFIPSQEKQPMYIVRANGKISETNAFLVPQWGGVVIANQQNKTLTADELRGYFEIFIGQFRELLGLPALTTGKILKSERSFWSVTFVASPVKGITKFELDCLFRQQTVQNIFKSLSTLFSLARLVESIPRIVILDRIFFQVTDSLTRLHDSLNLLAKEKYSDSLLFSRVALAECEAAFFDPTMTAMVYFPDEHKYAVYTPLFFPIILPIFVAIVRKLGDIIKKMRKKEKSE